MATSGEEKEFASYIVDLMQSVGPVHSKRMFGGFGVFLEDLMFGLIADNVLYLKVDDDTRQEYDDLGLGPFTYNKQGKEFSLSYYQAPEEAMEDSEVMNLWAAAAYGTALRAAAKKNKRRKK